MRPRLNASIHTQQGTVNAVEIVQNLLMKLCKLLVQTDNTVAFAFAARLLVRTFAAILALVIFFGSAVFVSFHRSAVNV